VCGESLDGGKVVSEQGLTASAPMLTMGICQAAARPAPSDPPGAHMFWGARAGTCARAFAPPSARPPTFARQTGRGSRAFDQTW
jgi:hypothetical protein